MVAPPLIERLNTCLKHASKHTPTGNTEAKSVNANAQQHAAHRPLSTVRGPQASAKLSVAHRPLSTVSGPQASLSNSERPTGIFVKQSVANSERALLTDIFNGSNVTTCSSDVCTGAQLVGPVDGGHWSGGVNLPTDRITGIVARMSEHMSKHMPKHMSKK